MANGYKPEIIEKPRILDLTNNGMRLRQDNRNQSKKTIEKRYEKLKVRRQSFLERAEKFSAFTVPNLYHDDKMNGADGIDTTGWQSFGSDCVASVTNKLVMTLFPPHQTFARLELTPDAKALLVEEDANVVDEEGALVNAQKSALLEHERLAGRVGLGEALEHLVVGGNACLYLPDEGNLICYPLSRYVARRDKSGNLLELIIEESKAIDVFDPAVQAIIKSSRQYNQKMKDDNEVNLYTRVLYKGDDFYQITEEVVGEKVGTEYRVHRDNLPWIVLRWKTNYGEDYGRSLVEQYAGDFAAIQFLSEALAKGMILMADIKYLVRPGSVTDVDHLIESPTGEFVYGNIEDIGVLQLEKYADFTPIANVLDKYERRVGVRFMIGSQRDAERVTAYEVRQDALRMEQSLGGAYTLLALTLQRPYFKLLLRRIGFTLSDKYVNAVITTGIEALSKLGDADKFLQWSEAMMQAANLPEGVQSRIKWGDFAKYTANQLSLELPYMMTEEEFTKMQQVQQAAMQQQQAAEAMANASPKVADNLTKPQ